MTHPGPRTGQRLIEHLQSLDLAILLVSQDLRLLARLATRALWLENSRLRPAALHSHPHSHVHVEVDTPAHGLG